MVGTSLALLCAPYGICRPCNCGVCDPPSHGAVYQQRHIELERLDDLEAFLAVIEKGSQAAASRHLRRPLQSLNRSLMAAGLVDRIELTIFPVISGRTGTSPVLAGAGDFDLELLESQTFDCRSQLLVYRPTAHR